MYLSSNLFSECWCREGELNPQGTKYWGVEVTIEDRTL